MYKEIAADVRDPEADASGFHHALIQWGHKYFRHYPWRYESDPFRIMMAEIMLHRTQAKQVVPVYLRFVERYSNIQSLAVARPEEMQAILYPLGLRWRTDLVRQMAIELTSRFHGRIPCNRDDLLSLPGISDYICSAVRCFAWNLADPIIDTNTIRVVGRLRGVEVKDSSRRNPHFRRMISELVSFDSPREYSYGLLDLAGQICVKRKAPDCQVCPVSQWCKFGHSAVTRYREV